MHFLVNSSSSFASLYFISGCLGKTKRGELSIFPKSFVLLSHCLHMMPRQKAVAAAENVKVNGCSVGICSHFSVRL